MSEINSHEQTSQIHTPKKQQSLFKRKPEVLSELNSSDDDSLSDDSSEDEYVEGEKRRGPSKAIKKPALKIREKPASLLLEQESPLKVSIINPNS